MGELIYLPVIFNFGALENWGWEEFLLFLHAIYFSFDLYCIYLIHTVCDLSDMEPVNAEIRSQYRT